MTDLELSCHDVLARFQGAGEPRTIHAWTFLALGLGFSGLEPAVASLERLLLHQDGRGVVPESPKSPNAALPLLSSVLRHLFFAIRIHRQDLEGRIAELVPRLERFHAWLYADRTHLYRTRPGDGGVLCAALTPRLDVGFNAVLVQAESDLADVAIHTGHETQALMVRRTRRAQALSRKLWREDLGCFCSRGRGWEPLTAEGLLPLYAGCASPRQARQMAGHLRPDRGFWAPFPLATVPLSAPGFRPDAIEGGAISPLVNWLVIFGLHRYGLDEEARTLKESTLALARGGIWEAYHPLTGEGLGQRDDPVAAAVVLGLIKAPYHAQQMSLF